jgi:hypothetical protein
VKFENTEVWGFEHAIRGMRNPKNSWDKSDSCYLTINEIAGHPCNDGLQKEFVIGENDLKLMQKLIRAGSEHRKFLRQIFVSVDITAPLYWWKEFDTYKIGTVANSTSTMHKLANTPITLECFEIDDFNKDLIIEQHIEWECPQEFKTNNLALIIIKKLEMLRQKYLETKDKRYWKELIRWLPESWLQKRTITMNYENILTIYRQRKNHKLNEWSGADNSELSNYISWVKTLPYAETLILIEN